MRSRRSIEKYKKKKRNWAGSMSTICSRNVTTFRRITTNFHERLERVVLNKSSISDIVDIVSLFKNLLRQKLSICLLYIIILNKIGRKNLLLIKTINSFLLNYAFVERKL